VNDCINVEVRDALPDFINHRLSDLDSAIVREHIESCADCKAELELLREARATARLAPKVDVHRIAASLPSYSPIRSTSIRTSSRRTWALAAAAAVVAIGGWAISTRQPTNDAPAVAVATPAPTSQAEHSAPATISTPAIVKTAPSENVAGSVKEVDVAALSLVGSTEGLSDDDLETLVAALDGIDAVPSAEPGSVTTTVEDIDGNDDQ
jgi:anti-sigma factor RsiW